jgi:hypothetical protein
MTDPLDPARPAGMHDHLIADAQILDGPLTCRGANQRAIKKTDRGSHVPLFLLFSIKPACAQFCKRARELVEILSAGSIRLAGHYDSPTHLDIDAPTCDWDWLPQSHLAANDQANALRSCNIAVAG